MAPNTTNTLVTTGILFEDDVLDNKLVNPEITKRKYVKNDYKIELVWYNIVASILGHSGAIYGIYLMFTSAKIVTTIFALFLYVACMLGVTAGTHRLWSHKTFKAKWPLRLLLLILNTTAFQMPVIIWARDHRVHHKYSDTDADPYNARRGFFFSHIGWLLSRKHPEHREKAKNIDMSDLYADPMLTFQKKYYYTFLMPLFCFVIPTVVPVYCWNESWTNAFFVPAILRWMVVFNTTALVNSATHTFGMKPYDKNIYARENKFVNFFVLGEGWHNYHHVFPWDYKTAEFGNFTLNLTATFIEFFAWLGLAYDLKTVSIDMVKSRVERTGDGTHGVWGWGDKNITKEDRKVTIVSHKKVVEK